MSVWKYLISYFLSKLAVVTALSSSSRGFHWSSQSMSDFSGISGNTQFENVSYCVKMIILTPVKLRMPDIIIWNKWSISPVETIPRVEGERSQKQANWIKMWTKLDLTIAARNTHWDTCAKSILSVYSSGSEAKQQSI